MNRITVLCFFFLICGLLDPEPGECEQPSFVLDLATGEVDGRQGLVAYPALYFTHKFEKFIDPRGFRVHLAPMNDPDRELVFPCGEWFAPPPREWYRVWIEGDDLITPYGSEFNYRGGPFRGGGAILTYPVAPAGTIRLDPDWIAESSILHLFAAVPPVEGDLRRVELIRHLPSVEIGEGVQMPAGPVIAGLWNSEKSRYEALARPVEVRAGQATTITFEPAAGADLLVRLRREENAGLVSMGDAELSLHVDERTFRPHRVIPAARSVLAVWYGLPAGPATLRGHSAGEVIPATELFLEDGTAEYWKGRFLPGEELEIVIDLPEALFEKEVVLEVRDSLQERLLRREIPSSLPSLRLDSLPPEKIEVVLETWLGVISRTVDLARIRESFLLLDPEILELTGTVFFGDEGHRASLRFEAVTGGPIEVEADAFEEYELLSLVPIRAVTITLPEEEAAPYFDFFPRTIRESRSLDFHLSDADVEVEVIDARSGEPISGAQVSVRMMEAESAGGKAIHQTVVSGEDGRARLPPLRPGSLELTAEAEGYRAMADPVERAVSDPPQSETVPIRLEPLGETLRVALRLSNELPASGASVHLVDGLDTARELLAVRSDSLGLTELPAWPARGVLLLRHPEAGFSVQVWRPDPHDEDLEIRLPARALAPLRVRTVDRSEEPVAGARIALRVHGSWLTGSALAYLTRQPPVSSADGEWTLHGLPNAPIAVAAFSGKTLGGVETLEAWATPLVPPWLGPVQVQVAR